jgi:hypothetical protein
METVQATALIHKIWGEKVRISNIKGPLAPMEDKPVLGNVTWSPSIFRFLEFFCENAPRNKLHGSTNFVFFGPTDQKLWGSEVFKRSPGSQKTFYILTFLGYIFLI